MITLAALCGGRAAAQSEVKAAVGLALPPYVIKGSDSGAEIDIVRQALKLARYDLKVEYVPFARLPVSLGQKSVDCALTINEGSGLSEVYYSDSHISYQNVIVTLRSRNLRITSIKDLQPLRVVAFQNAAKYLGSEYAAMAKAKEGHDYNEMANQESQVRLLFVDRADALVMDINIFKYFKRSIQDVDVSADVAFHRIFKPTPYKVAFTDKTVRDRFNVGLRQLRRSGAYKAIFRTYLK